MNTIARIAITSITFAIALSVVPISEAQQPSNPPAAPIPSQILTAKKVFISNSQNEATDQQILGVPNLTYNEFYASIKAWGRYELVSAPADADLVFEVSFNPVPAMQLRVWILDPKTHVQLWPVIVPVEGWTREATGRKNFDTAMAALIEQLKILTLPPLPAAAPGN